jgi:hypothetical protein
MPNPYPPQSGANQTEKKYQSVHPDGIYQVTVLDHALVAKKSDATSLYLCVYVQVDKLKKAFGSGTVAPIIPNAQRKLNVYFTEKTIEGAKAFLEEAGFRGQSTSQLDAEAAKRKNLPFISLKGFSFEAINRSEKSEDGKVYDRFSLAPRGGVGNKWMEKLNRPSDIGFATLDSLWKSSSRTSGVSAQKRAATQQDAPVREYSDADENAPPFAPDDAEFTSEPQDWD